MKNSMIENRNSSRSIALVIENSEALKSGSYIFPTRFLQMYKKFILWRELEIQLESVAAYVGELGMFLNASCNNKRIGIGVHPIWMRNEDGSIIGIDMINYVFMTSNELKRMLSFQNSINNVGYTLSSGEPVFIDESDFTTQCTGNFMKMMRITL